MHRIVPRQVRHEQRLRDCRTLLAFCLLTVATLPSARVEAQQAGDPEPSIAAAEAARMAALRRPSQNATEYTWQDGGRTLRIWLQPNLEWHPQGEDADLPISASATVGGGLVTEVRETASATGSAGATASTGQPVFVNEAGGMMTLPGGVLLALDADWGQTEVDAFLSANGIPASRVSSMAPLPNTFFVETEPGLPSLELANELAAKTGVEIASPNWGMEFEAL